MERITLVKTELDYNPYLMQTNIKFNGQIPRINSLVEKYQQEILQNWMKMIPGIFYDEMNGYDFELEFSGTKLEFEDLCNTFRDAGVTNEMVRLFHKNELDERKVKAQKIDELLEWFQKNPNRKFAFTTFMEKNNEFFASDYVCILLNGSGIVCEFPEYQVSLEVVEDVTELANTELLYTPIIMWIDEETREKIKSNVRYFLNRKDVTQDQIFFMIHPSLNALSIGRTIQDLGVENPQLIKDVSDERVKRFLE